MRPPRTAGGEGFRTKTGVQHGIERPSGRQVTAILSPNEISTPFLADHEHLHAAARRQDFDKTGAFFRDALPDRAGETACHQDAADGDDAIGLGGTQSIQIFNSHRATPEKYGYCGLSMSERYETRTLVSITHTVYIYC